jgi:hypothetical protein
MVFRISGHVREKESGLGVRGLMIRAYDKDLLYDDLLGTANSDDKGRFEIVYTEKDFRELFEAKPDIYLTIYAPPFRLLIDTEKAVRWGATDHEVFELEIDRETLGDISPSRPDDVVEGGISLPKNALIVEKRGGFDVPKLPGFSTGGVPGAPALPEQIQYVALPLDGDIVSLEIIPGEPFVLPGQVNPLPAQEPVPDVGTDPDEFGDGFSVDNVHITFTPPDPKYFERKLPYPKTLVRLDEMGEIGPVQIAAVRVRPVQFDPINKSFIFYPNLRYTVKFDFEKAQRAFSQRKENIRVGSHLAAQVNAFLQTEMVLAARELFWPDVLDIYEDVPYVIITDNHNWPESVDRGDGTIRSPDISERGAPLSGDLVTEFERLAEWKTSRGVYSRVVTISDIVSGRYGDFTKHNFARDLQEVLRNFIKHVQRYWCTLYVLLAGDVNVVPIRRLVGAGNSSEIGCRSSVDNPPPEGRCHFVSGKATVKLHTRFTPQSFDPLSTLRGGIRVPFKREAGSDCLGWYYTTEADFASKDEGFTRLPNGQTSRYIVVEGPESIIEDDYYWLLDRNSIPSDLYYAGLFVPGYLTDPSMRGKHDFDSNDNGLYGQFYYDSETGKDVLLDAIDLWPDVWVGRAPVENDGQARAFVNKIITYERLESPDGSATVDVAYLQKILYGCKYWELWFQERQTDTSSPPLPGKFTHIANTYFSEIHLFPFMHLELIGGIPSFRLVAQYFNNSKMVIPYNTCADATNPGWYFTTDDSFDVQSNEPTRFVKVVGPENDINPWLFFWDPVALERATEQKENLRGLINNWFPSFTDVERHYWDYTDLSVPPPLIPLEATTIRDALDSGIHFVSLTGHGSWAGCSDVNINSRPDFANDNRFSIMFASSCSTARPDDYDSLGEVSVLDPDGGAVAYVGSTREMLIGYGDNYEEFFWMALKVFGRLGPAAGLRLASGCVRKLKMVYGLMLFGDPEMPVWTDLPSSQQVMHPSSVARGGTVGVTVHKLDSPAAGHCVTLMGGWTNSSVRPRIFMTKTTNSFGQASFNLPSSGTEVSQLKVTVTHPNFKPYVGAIDITG